MSQEYLVDSPSSRSPSPAPPRERDHNPARDAGPVPSARDDAPRRDMKHHQFEWALPLDDPSRVVTNTVDQAIGQVGQTTNQAGQTVNQVGQTLGQAVGSGAGQGKNALKLRLDINLDVDIEIKARVHGDVTLSLL
jgi:hypothetical protein